MSQIKFGFYSTIPNIGDPRDNFSMIFVGINYVI
jgi:hypothetical protein